MFFVTERDADFFVVEKGVKGSMKPGHKYIQRKGMPGAYKYLYKLPSGQYVWGDDPSGPPANHTELPKHDTHGDAVRHIQKLLKTRGANNPGGRKKLGEIDKFPWQGNEGENKKHSPVIAHVQAEKTAPTLYHVSPTTSRKEVGSRGVQSKSKLTHQPEVAARQAIKHAMTATGLKESELTRADVAEHAVVAEVKNSKNIRYHDGHGSVHPGSGTYTEGSTEKSGTWVASSGHKWDELHAGKRVTDLLDKHDESWDKNLKDAGHRERLPGDRGKHDNFLSDPRYTQVAGKDIDLMDASEFLRGFETDFKEDTQKLAGKLRAAGATHFGSRLKDRVSLLRKMRTDKMEKRSLNTVTDAIGARGLTDDLAGQQKSLAEIKRHLDIVELEDSTEKGRDSGYRAVHILYRMGDGRIGELQIKTYRQQLFSGFTHDNVYKAGKAVSEDPEVVAYSVAVSKYLYDLDSGKKEDRAKRPVLPKILADRGIKFPWAELDEFGEKKAATVIADAKKFFVVMRQPGAHGTNVNMGVHEFDNFTEAKRFRDRYREKGHKGELPIGYADSKAEFLDTFHEYRTEDWDLVKNEATRAALRQKVQRRKPGFGQEIKLTERETKELLKGGKYALVSAGRNESMPEERKLSDYEIKLRGYKLEEKLIDQGYVYTRVKGKYGKEEDSFLIMAHDADRDQVKKIGKEFNQDSVIYSEGGKHEMHYTTGANAGLKQVGEGHKIVPNATDFYTEHTTKEGVKLRFSLNFLDDLVKAVRFYIEDKLAKAVAFVVGDE